MAPSVTVLVLTCVAVLASTSLLCHAKHLQKSPVYMFSNVKVLGDGKANQVMYQTSSVATVIARAMIQKSDNANKADVTVVYVGSKGQQPAASSLHSLADLVKGAASSATFVNAEQAHGCNGDTLKVQDINTAGQQTLLVCSSGAENEVEELQQLSSLLAGSSRKYVVVYAPDASGSGWSTAATRRRSLSAAVTASTGICDATCQTQVKWLEGMLAALLMALAAFSGLCCLHFLEVPTKFEAPKEA